MPRGEGPALNEQFPEEFEGLDFKSSRALAFTALQRAWPGQVTREHLEAIKTEWRTGYQDELSRMKPLLPWESL